MKEAIHPTYHQAAVHCQGCQRDFTVGSTAESITVELCSACHPFYTGKQKLVDTAGRVDRFRARQAKAAGGASDPVKSNAAKSDTADAPAEVATPESRLSEMKQQLESKSEQPESGDAKSDQ